MQPTIQDIWSALAEVKDPEIPVVSLVEMGVIRDVKLDGERATVTITPTFVGCPALIPMREDISARIKQLGISEVEVKTSHNPPWTSEWIGEEARAKLKAFGLAPPPRHNGAIDIPLLAVATCPNCGSSQTALDSMFGPTPCRSIYYCHNCKQSFEQFKPL